MRLKKLTYKMYGHKDIKVYQTIIRSTKEEEKVLFNGKVSELHEKKRNLLDRQVSFVDCTGGKLIVEVEGIDETVVKG